MFVIILLIIMAVIATALLIVPIRYDDTDGNPQKSRALSFVPIAVIFLVLLCTSWTQVEPKHVGVLQTLGSVSERTLDSGFHLKLPWQKVTEIDATIQTDRYHGDKCIKVQLGDGSNSCISLTNSWYINGKKANDVFQNYRSDNPTEQFRDAVVSTQLISSAVIVARTYNPIASLKVVDPGSTANPPTFGPDYEVLADLIKADLIERTRGMAVIDSLNVTAIPLDETTQAKINNFTAEVAETRTQQQRQLTKAAEAAGNKELAASLRNDPLLLVSKCLDLVADGKIDTSGNFQCFAGQGATPVFPVAGNK